MGEHDFSNDWKDWFRDHGSRLLLFARSQTRSNADAQDVLQDSMLRLWKSYSSAEEESPPPPLPLAYTAIRHAAVDQARRNTRRTKREQKSEYLVDDDATASDWFGTAGLEEKERAAAIQEAISKLPPKFSEVLTLKIWGEQTFAEIAESLGIPLNTAASRYRYALDALRKNLKPNSF
jgi:RNA polymerase sigma-70 factor (ECF subfamily)